MSIKYPFLKLLIYFAALSKVDRKGFEQYLEEYLPSINFENEDPFIYIQRYLESKPIPKPILTGKYTPQVLNIFLKQQGLLTLHTVFNTPEFHEIIYDSDIRRKLDGMILSSIFRKNDILLEFNKYNPIHIDTYMDCFSNYKELENKRSFIANYIGDKNERNLFERILDNTSRQYLKMVLGIKLPDASPLDIINNNLHVANLKMQTALLAEDDIALDKWMKLSTTIAEKLHKVGAGQKRDIDELLDALKADPVYEDPKIYSMDELEEKYKDQNS